MTDYLEQLLDERQDEDEKEPFAWKRRRTGNRSLTGEDGAERQTVRQERVGAEHAAGRDEGLWEETAPVKNRKWWTAASSKMQSRLRLLRQRMEMWC